MDPIRKKLLDHQKLTKLQEMLNTLNAKLEIRGAVIQAARYMEEIDAPPDKLFMFLMGEMVSRLTQWVIDYEKSTGTEGE